MRATSPFARMIKRRGSPYAYALSSIPEASPSVSVTTASSRAHTVNLGYPAIQAAERLAPVKDLAVALWQELAVHLRTADDKNRAFQAGLVQPRDIAHNVDAVARRQRTAEHDIAAPREWPAERFERPPAHHHGMPESQPFKKTEVIGQMPGEPALAADDPV